MIAKRTSILTMALLISTTAAYAAPNPTLQADNQAIGAACASEAATAGCGSEQVGKGLLKCLHAYKKANPGYKFSANCKAAMQKRHADKQAGK